MSLSCGAKYIGVFLNSIILFTVLQDGLDVNIVLPRTRLNSLSEF